MLMLPAYRFYVLLCIYVAKIKRYLILWTRNYWNYGLLYQQVQIYNSECLSDSNVILAII